MTSTAASPAPRASARVRLLAAADELFYREGINNVGIDRVIEQAGVAKASLYAHFRSKEELVRAYLQDRHEVRKATVLDHIARHRSPRERLLAVFDSVTETRARPGYRGCAFVRANAEMPEGSSVKAVCDTARGWQRELFRTLAAEAGARDPGLLAQQLMLLYDGAVIAKQMDGAVDAALAARTMAADLLEASSARGPRK
jgi:AcrR family transcriptional regulator